MKTNNEDKKSRIPGVEKSSSREPELKTKLQCLSTQLPTHGPTTLDLRPEAAFWRLVESSSLKVQRTNRECL